MKKILVLNDKDNSRKDLLNLLEFRDREIKVYAPDTLQEAWKILLVNDINLFIIDVMLYMSDKGNMSGMYFAEAVREMQQYYFTPIIFLSSIEDPKMFTYKQLHCYAFLEKPYDKGEFIKTVEMALRFPQNPIKKRNLYIKDDGVLYSVRIKDILYMKSERRRLHIYTENEIFTVKNKTLENIIEEINSHDFIRCSRFYVINKKYVKSIDYVNRFIELIGTKELIDIGPSMVKNLKNQFENR